MIRKLQTAEINRAAEIWLNNHAAARGQHPAGRPLQSLSADADMPQTTEAVNCEEAAP